MPRVTVQNVVLPFDDDASVRALYVRGDEAVLDPHDRRRLRLPSGATASFGTYFNAVPVAYWKRWTTVRALALRLRVTGEGAAKIHRSGPDGSIVETRTVPVATGEPILPLSLEGVAEDGGWAWFDLTAGEGGLVLEAGEWTCDQPADRPARAAIGITTFNKPDYCVATLSALGRARELHDVLARVFVVDQGDREVSAEPGFAEAADDLGPALEILRQPNLGGSGGYARAMLETLALDDAEFVMLIDDDVRIEPESVWRAIVFGSFCREPAIVGGHMIDLHDRTHLYAWAEVVDERPFMWRPLHEERMPIDLSEVDLRAEPLLHRRMDADYNGWWMCLIPREALRRVGMPLPAFIKWDDAEYSLRARERGIPTLSLPGVALWHISWVGKDDQIDWQAYFHARNRIVAALLHSRQPRGGSLLEHSRRVDLKHLMAMQYFPIEIRHRALRDVLSGPEHLHRDLGNVLAGVRQIASRFPETRPAPVDVTAPPGPAHPGDDSDLPAGWRLRLFMLRSLTRQWLRRPRRRDEGRAEVRMAARDARWWRLEPYDSAIVEMAGSGAAHLFERDRTAYRRLLRESIRLHRRLARSWEDLSARYRAEDLTSPERWRETLGR